MPLEGFWQVLPSLTSPQLVTAIVVILLIVGFLLAKRQLVPGVQRFAAQQKREATTQEFLLRQIQRLEESEEEARHAEQEANREKHQTANRLQVFVIAYDHLHGLLLRCKELCADDTLEGESVSALREVCHETERVKSCKELLQSKPPTF